MNKYDMSADDCLTMLNKKSGVLALSDGVSSDFRDLDAAAAQGNEAAQLALDKFAYEVKKYIGAYAAALGGVDCIVFTAGVGENSAPMRASICDGLEYLGVKLDAEKLILRPFLEKYRVLSHAYVLLFVTLGFVLFDAACLSDALKTLGALFGAGSLAGASQEALYLLRSNAVLLVLAAAGATPLPARLCRALSERRAGLANILEPLGILLLLALCTAYLVDGSFSPFLYFRF